MVAQEQEQDRVAVNKRKTLLTRIDTPGGDDPLLLVLVAPTVIRSGTAVSGLALVGQGGAGGYAYSILTGSAYGDLPPGLTLNADGTITGTPTTPGNYAFVAQVQDADSSVYTASFSIRILSRLFRKHKSIRPGEVGLAYSFTFMVGGNTGSVTWSVESGNLPAGLSLDTSTGIVSGIPTADSSGLGGTSYFTLRATDGGSGEHLDLPSSILVYEALHMPGFTGSGVPIVVRGQYFELAIPVEGGHPAKTFTIIGDPFEPDPGAPATRTGVKFDPATGVWSGVTLIDPDYYAFGVRVTDALGATLLHFETLQVINPNSRIQLQQGSSDVGDPGIDTLNFVAGSGIDVNVGSSGGAKTVTISSTPGSGGIDTINGVGPDSSGNIDFVSPDASVGINVNSSGEIELTADGGGDGSIFADFDATPGEVEAAYSRPISIPFGYSITSWRVLGGESDTGSAVFDVLRRTTIGGSATSIVGTTPPSVAGANAAEGSDMSGWTTDGDPGDLIVFHLTSAAAFHAVRIELLVTKQ